MSVAVPRSAFRGVWGVPYVPVFAVQPSLGTEISHHQMLARVQSSIWPGAFFRLKHERSRGWHKGQFFPHRGLMVTMLPNLCVSAQQERAGG